MSVFVPPRVSGVARHQNIATDEELEKMRSKADLLFAKAGDITGEVKKAELNGCKLKGEVQIWFQKVENVKAEKQCIEDQVRGAASSSRTVPVAEIMKEIDELLQHSLPGELTVSGDASSNVPFVTESLKGHLFEENRKQILSFLDDDNVATIGIHGAGGIGKTTLVTHVQKGLCEKFNNDRCSGNVYFVTVSHGLTVSGLQSKIAKQLDLKIEGKDEKDAAARIHGAFMKRKNSVLILDDLWESFRPSKVGLPVGEGGFKLLLTTRNKSVCLEINNKKYRIIEVKCLSDDESWDLFREKLGDSAILSQAGVIDIARKVVKKCSGLPLALEHIAISMRAADTVEDWRTVLADMSSMMHDVVEDKVLPLLRYSYDRLRDQRLKDCFLYCSLFPEDHVFRRTELVDSWIREGLLDGIENRERQRDKGFKIFKELIDLSLLKADDNKYQRAKMHDLVREMAVKVGEKKGFLIRAGEKMQGFLIPGEGEWNEDLCKVSLMYNDIGSISPDVAPRCPNLSTLLLNTNYSLTSISSLFFSLMDGLCVLDLSDTGIEKLPDSVSNLKNLTALLLRGCYKLNYVPSVSMLGKLREMDISHCDELRDLPRGMEGLLNLKVLDSFECPAPVSGILSGLSHLEELTLSEAKGQDLMKWKNLKRLKCRIRNVCEFNEYVMSQCFASLHHYDLIVGPLVELFLFERRLVDDYIGMRRTRTVAFLECRFEEDSPIVPGNVERLGLNMCSGVEYLVSSASPDSTFIPLQTLGNLVELRLNRLENFKGLVKPGVALPPGSLSNLKGMWIRGCDGIKKLFTSSMVRGNLQNLEYLEIAKCPHLEEVIGSSDSDNDDDDGDEYRADNWDDLATSKVEIKDERLSIYFPCSPRLYTLYLRELPNFKRLSCPIRNVSEFNEYVMSKCFASLHRYHLTVGPGSLYNQLWKAERSDDYFCMRRTVEFVECRFEEDSPIVPGNVGRLDLVKCSGVEYLVSSASPDLIPLQTLGNLVELFLDGLENFKGLVKPGVALPPGSLSNLKRIWIEKCDGIKKLFTSSMVRGNLQNLEELHISECRHLEVVIENDDEDDDERLSIYFPYKAFRLSLGWLPNFKRVVRGRQNGRENGNTEKLVISKA
ncbi:hypothetical protein Drorol1_Dr00014954 [Drosera rotundifolia]